MTKCLIYFVMTDKDTKNTDTHTPDEALAFDDLKRFLSAELSKREGYAIAYSTSQTNNLLNKNTDLWRWLVVSPTLRVRVSTKEQAKILLSRIKLNKRTKRYEIHNYRQADKNYFMPWRARFLLDPKRQPHLPLRSIDVLTLIQSYIYEGYTNPQLQKLLERQHKHSPYPTLQNPKTGAVKRFYQGDRLDELLAHVLRIRESRPVQHEIFSFALALTSKGDKVPLFTGTLTNGDVFSPKQTIKNIWIENENLLCFGFVASSQDPETKITTVKTRAKEKTTPITKQQIACANTIIRQLKSFVLAWRYLFSLFSLPDDIDENIRILVKDFVIPFFNPPSLADKKQEPNPTLYDFAQLSSISAKQIESRPEGFRTRTQIRYDIERQVKAVKEQEAANNTDFDTLEQADKEYEMSEEKRKEIDAIFFADMEENAKEENQE
jgi:hypothetical protein